jgi:hypothetical protein
MTSLETNKTLEEIYAEQQEFTTLEIGQYEAVKILVAKWLSQKRQNLEANFECPISSHNMQKFVDTLLEELK